MPKTKPEAPAARSQERGWRGCVIHRSFLAGVAELPCGAQQTKTSAEPQQDLLILDPISLPPPSSRDHEFQKASYPSLALGVIKWGLSREKGALSSSSQHNPRGSWLLTVSLPCRSCRNRPLAVTCLPTSCKTAAGRTTSSSPSAASPSCRTDPSAARARGAPPPPR